VVVGAAIVDALASLGLAYPKVDKKRLEEIARAKELLQSNHVAAKKAAA
jgi:hypothetical protein